ncbi:MAG: hypothetical protein R3B96_14175 [Pirellulaceae bacterium]
MDQAAFIGRKGQHAYLVARRRLDPGDQWRRQLPPDVTVTLGRSERLAVLGIPRCLASMWLSRFVRVRLHVERLPQAAQSVFVAVEPSIPAN